MEDVSVVAAILFGLWVFFVTARRNNNTSLTEQSLPKTDSAVSPSSETDTLELWAGIEQPKRGRATGPLGFGSGTSRRSVPD